MVNAETSLSIRKSTTNVSNLQYIPIYQLNRAVNNICKYEFIKCFILVLLNSQSPYEGRRPTWQSLSSIEPPGKHLSMSIPSIFLGLSARRFGVCRQIFCLEFYSRWSASETHIVPLSWCGPIFYPIVFN